MLTEQDIREVELGFGIYDHEWRAYVPTLGEPFLLGRFLAYFDGLIVYLCAYALGDTEYVLPERELVSLLASREEFSAARGVVVWGRFEAPSSLIPGESPDEPLPRIMLLDPDEDVVDSVVNLPQLFSPQGRSLPRAYRAAKRRSPLRAETRQLQRLEPEHLALIDFWAASHSISPFHASFACGVSAYVNNPAVYTTEVRLDGCLLGFAVIAMSSADHAVFLQNFNSRFEGLSIGDAVYAAMFDFVAERDVTFLHLGYSATPGLLRFKRKWGALADQPPYREAGFTHDPELASAIREHRVDWRNRAHAAAA